MGGVLSRSHERSRSHGGHRAADAGEESPRAPAAAPRPSREPVERSRGAAGQGGGRILELHRADARDGVEFDAGEQSADGGQQPEGGEDPMADEQAGEAAEEAPGYGEAALGHEAAACAARAQVPALAGETPGNRCRLRFRRGTRRIGKPLGTLLISPMTACTLLFLCCPRKRVVLFSSILTAGAAGVPTRASAIAAGDTRMLSSRIRK